MNERLIEEAIRKFELQGRSFTYGVAFIKLVESGYFNFRDEIYDLIHQLAEALANEIDGDETKIYNTMPLEAIVKSLDISIVDELVTEYLEAQNA